MQLFFLSWFPHFRALLEVPGQQEQGVCCNTVACSRYVENHIVDYNQRIEHCMILNYIDLPVNIEKLKMDAYTRINKIKFKNRTKYLHYESSFIELSYSSICHCF